MLEFKRKSLLSIMEYLSFDKIVSYKGQKLLDKQIEVLECFHDYVGNNKERNSFIDPKLLNFTNKDLKDIKLFILPFITGNIAYLQCSLLLIEIKVKKIKEGKDLIFGFAEYFGISEIPNELIIPLKSLNIRIFKNENMSEDSKDIIAFGMAHIKDRYLCRLNIFENLTNEELAFIQSSFPIVDRDLNVDHQIVTTSNLHTGEEIDIRKNRKELVKEIKFKLKKIDWFDFQIVKFSYLLKKLHIGSTRYLNESDYLLFNDTFYKSISSELEEIPNHYAYFSIYTWFEYQILLGLNEYIINKQGLIELDRKNDLDKLFTIASNQEYIKRILNITHSAEDKVELNTLFERTKKYLDENIFIKEYIYLIWDIKIQISHSKLAEILSNKLKSIEKTVTDIWGCFSIKKINNETNIDITITNYFRGASLNSILFMKLPITGWKAYKKTSQTEHSEIYLNKLAMLALDDIMTKSAAETLIKLEIIDIYQLLSSNFYIPCPVNISHVSSMPIPTQGSKNDNYDSTSLIIDSSVNSVTNKSTNATDNSSNDDYLTLFGGALLYGNNASGYYENDKSCLDINKDLQTYAASCGYGCVDVSSNGNCFYLAIAVQINQVLTLNFTLKDQEQLARGLRIFACEYIEKNREVYEKFLDNSFEFKNQKNDKVWVEDVVITALCYALNVNLVLLRSDSKQNIKKLPNAVCTLFLGYQVELHYQSLTPLNANEDKVKQEQLAAIIGTEPIQQFETPITISTQEELKETLSNLFSANQTNIKLKVKQKFYDELMHSTVTLGEEKLLQAAIRESLEIISLEKDKTSQDNLNNTIVKKPIDRSPNNNSCPNPKAIKTKKSSYISRNNNSFGFFEQGSFQELKTELKTDLEKEINESIEKFDTKIELLNNRIILLENEVRNLKEDNVTLTTKNVTLTEKNKILKASIRDTSTALKISNADRKKRIVNMLGIYKELLVSHSEKFTLLSTMGISSEHEYVKNLIVVLTNILNYEDLKESIDIQILFTVEKLFVLYGQYDANVQNEFPIIISLENSMHIYGAINYKQDNINLDFGTKLITTLSLEENLRSILSTNDKNYLKIAKEQKNQPIEVIDYGVKLKVLEILKTNELHNYKIEYDEILMKQKAIVETCNKLITQCQNLKSNENYNVIGFGKNYGS